MQSRKLPPLPDNKIPDSQPNVQAYAAAQQRIPLQGSDSRISLGSMISMQSFCSSESVTGESLPPEEVTPNQTFKIIYKNKIFMVDPNCLLTSSHKFKELVDPLLKNQTMDEIYIIVPGNRFTLRNMSNFLKLCQKLPTDVENDEMKEICEIARLFKANDIYNTGIGFIKQNIDPNFSVPENKYDGSDGKTYIYAQGENECINHCDDEKEQGQNEGEKENSKKDESSPAKNKYDNMKSVVYYVRCEPHTIKCPVFRFCDKDHIIFSAKQKENAIFFAEGSNVHVDKNKCKHVAYIHRLNCGGNTVHVGKEKFKVNYAQSGKPDLLSLDVTFPFKGEQITWTPKEPKYDAMNDKYYLNFHGEYHHTPLKSNKNIVLQNSEGQPTFIVRKMDNNLFEIECLPVIDPLIAFTIGLCDIVGQYVDPYDAIELMNYKNEDLTVI